MLIVAGGLLGLILSVQGVTVASSLLPRQLASKLPAGAESVALNTRVLGFTFLASAVAMLVSSLVPLARTSRVDVVRGLKTVTRTLNPQQIWTSRHEFDTGATAGERPTADVRSVDAGYFRMLRSSYMSATPG